MEKTMVSVIVPCYKQAEYLPETLDCILAQTYQNWECIVIDDGSPDNTGDVASAYAGRDPRIKYMRQENSGVSAARNNAIRHSSGKYILPLDADDIVAPIYLEEAVRYFESHPECKLVYGLAEKFGVVNGRWELPEYDFHRMLFENLIFNPAVYRRSDFDKTIGYNENMREGIEDWDFWLTLLGPEDKVHRIEEVVYYYRIRKSSRNTVADDEEKMTRLFRTIYENHKEYYQEYVKDIVKYVRKCNAAQGRIDKLNNSLSMRIGRAVTLPFGKFRDLLAKWKRQ